MPTYYLRCQNEECGIDIENFVMNYEDRTKECPKCGAEVKQLFSKPPAIQFKGKGFYVNSENEEESDED